MFLINARVWLTILLRMPVYLRCCFTGKERKKRIEYFNLLLLTVFYLPLFLSWDLLSNLLFRYFADVNAARLPCFAYIVIQFYLWFKFYHFAFWYQMVIYDNKFETKENKISTKHKIEPQHIRRWPGILRQRYPFNNKITVCLSWFLWRERDETRKFTQGKRGKSSWCSWVA